MRLMNGMIVFFVSNLDPFLNSGFSLATLQESGTDDSEIERLMRSVMGLDSILESSHRVYKRMCVGD